MLLEAEPVSLAEPVPVTTSLKELPGSELEVFQDSDAGNDNDEHTVTHDPYQSDDACYI